MILNAARACGCDGYLIRTIQKPPAPSDPTVTPKATAFWGSPTPTGEEWDLRNAYALGLITLNVTNTVGLGVKTDGTAANAWKSLTDIQDLATDMGLINADAYLRSIRHTDGTDLGAHIKVLREAWAKSTAQGGERSPTATSASSYSPPCPKSGTYISALSLPSRHWRRSLPNSTLMMLCSLVTGSQSHRLSRPSLPHSISAPTLYARTPCAAVPVTRLISA